MPHFLSLLKQGIPRRSMLQLHRDHLLRGFEAIGLNDSWVFSILLADLPDISGSLSKEAKGTSVNRRMLGSIPSSVSRISFFLRTVDMDAARQKKNKYF